MLVLVETVKALFALIKLAVAEVAEERPAAGLRYTIVKIYGVLRVIVAGRVKKPPFVVGETISAEITAK
jgi:hypothetical protein